MAEVEALILAAGRGSRFAAAGGGTKMGALLDGKPLVRHVAEAALAADVVRVRVVLGHDAAAVRGLLAGLDLTLVMNPRYAEGLSTSLKAGVSSLPSTVDALIVLLGDMPCIDAGIIDALVAQYRLRPEAPAVVPMVAGAWGNPVLIARSLFPRLARLEGDRGARAVLEGLPVEQLAIEDRSVLFDVDTPDALQAVPKRNGP